MMGSARRGSKPRHCRTQNASRSGHKRQQNTSTSSTRNILFCGCHNRINASFGVG
jgi:hypothetical protein